MHTLVCLQAAQHVCCVAQSACKQRVWYVPPRACKQQRNMPGMLRRVLAARDHCHMVYVHWPLGLQRLAAGALPLRIAQERPAFPCLRSTAPVPASGAANRIHMQAQLLTSPPRGRTREPVPPPAHPHSTPGAAGLRGRGWRGLDNTPATPSMQPAVSRMSCRCAIGMVTTARACMARLRTWAHRHLATQCKQWRTAGGQPSFRRAPKLEAHLCTPPPCRPARQKR